jgi:hypothetical protein
MRGAPRAQTRSLLALAATSPAEAAGRYKIVTKTFSNLGEIQTLLRAGPMGPGPHLVS